MQRNRTILLTTVMFAAAIGSMTALFDIVGSSAHADPAASVDAAHSGWLEGTVLTPEGKPISGAAFAGVAIHVRGTRQGGGEFDVETDPAMGNLYTAQNIRPGIYTVTVPTGFVGGTPHCPQRIFGVIVKAGTRAVLDVTMDQGQSLIDTGKPNVLTEQVIPIADQLRTLADEIAALKQQVQDLKDRLDRTAPAQGGG